MATSWPQRGSKYSDFVLHMTNEAGLLETAVTFVVTVKSSWSTVEMIVQARDYIIKLVPKMKTRSSDLCP